jgi:hypothetical protein
MVRGRLRPFGRLGPYSQSQNPEHHSRSGVAFGRHNEVPMATRENHQIIETPTEARQAEPGPSVLALLAISTGLAVLILGVVWFVFFRT